MKVNDQQQDFSGGMVDNLPPDRIPANAYRFGENVECRNGILRTRRGQSELSAGIDPGENGPWMPVGSCRYVSASGTVYLVVALSGADGTLRTIISNPFINYEAEIALPEGVEVKPPDGITEEADAAGIFQYGRNLYMWRRALSQVFRFDGVFTSSMVWEALASEPTSGEEEWCPVSSAACVAYGRVWLATRSGTDYGVFDAVTASDITMMDEGGLSWDVVKHNWQVGAEDHSDIMALVPHTGGKIIVFKRHSVYALCGCEGYIDNVYVERLDASHGAVGGAAAMRVGEDVWYLSDEGVRSIVSDAQNNARAVDRAVSQPISTFLSESVVFSSTQRFLCSCAVHDSYALFTVPYGQATPNAIIAYDLEHGAWAGVWSHIYARQMHVVPHGTRQYLVGVGVNGALQHILTDGRWGQSDAPTATVITRALNCGSTERRKSYRGGILGLSSGGSDYSVSALDYDVSRQKIIASGRVDSEGWMLWIPDDGLDIPEDGIWLKDVDLVRRKFWLGVQARALCLSIVVESGAMDIRAIAVEASTGRVMSEI